MDDCSRRAFVRMSLASFAGLTTALPHLGCQAQKANAHLGTMRTNEPLNWDAFLSSVHELTKDQLKPDWDEDRYVAEAAKVISRLDVKDPALQAAFADYKDVHKGFPEIDAIHKEQLFQISLIEFEPGEVIKHHDHPTMTGVLLCASGELSVQNYDPLEMDDQLVLKELASVKMTERSVSTLTSRKRNIHRVAALKEFTQVIDIFAPPYNRERAQKSKWFEVDEDPYKGQKGLYAATVN